MAVGTVTLHELESRLWRAANALRGPVDPADFKTYVFPMLFYKWLSDTHDWEHRQAVADFGDALNDEIAADYHRFDLPGDAHWNKVTTATRNLGAKIAKALGKIEQANPDTLAGIFGDAAWGNKDRLVVMPHGALFRAGAEARIRQHLVERDLLEAVVGLPSNLFYSTTIPAALLIFRAQKAEERAAGVLFVDGSARFIKGRNQNSMSTQDIDAIQAGYQKGEEVDEVPTRLVPIEEIAENHFDLNIGRYLRPAIEDTLDVGTALEQFRAAREAMRQAEVALDERLEAAGYA